MAMGERCPLKELAGTWGKQRSLWEAMELEGHMLRASLLCWTGLLCSTRGYGPASERDPSRLPYLTAVSYPEPH